MIVRKKTVVPPPEKGNGFLTQTLEMMMEAEAERSQVNNQMLEILNGFRQQGETKLKLMKKLVAEKESNETD